MYKKMDNMNDYKAPSDMGLASKLYDAGKNYGKKTLVAASLVALLGAQGCSTLKENYSLNVNGAELTNNMYANANGNTVNDASGEQSWMKKNWPMLLLGAVVVGGAAYAISESNDGGSSTPSSRGGEGGGSD